MDDAAYEFIFRREHEHWWFRARRELIADAVRRAVPAGAPFLDVGCGTGSLLERLGDAVEPWGLDPSPESVARGRARGLAHLVEGDIGAIAGLPQAHFAGVGFFDVLEHLDDDVGALRLAHGALRPGGVVVATVPAFQWLWSRHDEVHQHRRRYSREAFGSLFREAGLAPEVLTYYNARLFPIAAAARLAGKALGLHGGADKGVPPAPVNRLLERVFLSERRALARAGTDGAFRAGLSVLAVGRRAD
ncbi:class I SAM-dependent methyltransferase [Roseisolibacter sp. H3M3-2]|uniref:class I SAM-dependent methyltransferase n=1 Tax=Roseisolibacter sp. H3M3-2 TaxID=3031323 RepID=UPI0023DBD171|nr:class I SAM-dependent methyltransferase [Roseisolibacter sp. H3M3-2]MDF1501889.1 class I SAM-dependent methyltransferase [Roseisolibacter sp. H3M3-2]